MDNLERIEKKIDNLESMLFELNEKLATTNEKLIATIESQKGIRTALAFLYSFLFAGVVGTVSFLASNIKKWF